MSVSSAGPTRFQRFVLPGLAFKAVVIGGGYATGRELVEFFLPSGPWGGVTAMLLATVIWSAVCVATFLFAFQTGARDYRTFFHKLLGKPGMLLFEASYLLFIVLILAVFGAAAGAIGEVLFGWPKLLGSMCLVVGIATFATFGNDAVEHLFKWVSFLLYGVYAIFVALALTSFGDRVVMKFSEVVPMTGWALGGLTYAGYNIIGAVVILPVMRHMTGRRDAIIAGTVAGPLAMIPALLFFICMVAYYPEVANETLPSDFLLQKLNLPVFHFLFQIMIFSALLESGTGAVHAINERIASAYQARRNKTLKNRARLAIACTVLIGSVFLADRFGLVALIAQGYRALAYIFLTIYVLPLLTYGVWRLFKEKTHAVA